MGVYISSSFRVLVNIEALNTVESLGNIIRHRKATIVSPRDGGFQLLTVPVVSGEAMRHGYQLMLAELAVSKGLRVCDYCKVGEFIKHGIISLINQNLLNILTSSNKSLAEKELEVIQRCVVEDVGGFLIPVDPIPVKRTSCLQISYLMPAVDDLKFGVDIHFHVRNAPGAQAQLARASRREIAQAPYYVESASAVYTFSTNLNLSSIGVTSNYHTESIRYLSLQNDVERLERAKLALLALAEFVKTGSFGGKHSSYQPFWTPLSAVIVVSSPLRISALPGHKHEYAEETYNIALKNQELLKKMGIEEKCKIFIFADNKFENKDVLNKIKEITDKSSNSSNKTSNEKAIEIKIFHNIAELFADLISIAENMLKEEMKQRA